MKVYEILFLLGDNMANLDVSVRFAAGPTHYFEIERIDGDVIILRDKYPEKKKKKMTKLEMHEFFAMAEKAGFEGMIVEYFYQAIKTRLAAESALELFPNEDQQNEH